MLGQPIPPVFTQKQGSVSEPPKDLLGQIGGLLGGAVEGIGGAAKEIGRLPQENPELFGLLAGALLGAPTGFGAIGAAGGLLSGAQQRSAAEASQIRQRQAILSARQARKEKLESQFRTDLRTEQREFKDRAISIKGIEDSLSRGTGIGDVAAVTSFQKLIDPSGRVSDQDFENAMKSAGFINETATKIKGVWTGVKLDGKARQNMLEAAVGQFKVAENVFDQTIKRSSEIANVEGLDVRNIISKPKVDFDIAATIKNNPSAFQATLRSDKRRRRKPQPKKIKTVKFDASGNIVF